MKNCHYLKLLFSVLFLTSYLEASVSFFFSAEVLRDASEAAMPVEGVVLLVAAGEDNAFTGPSAQSYVGGDDVLLGRFDLSGTGLPGIVETFVGPVDLPNATVSGQKIAVYWFPELTLANDAPSAGSSYGVYEPSSEEELAQWRVPVDGGSVALGLFSVDASILIHSGEGTIDSLVAEYEVPDTGNGGGTGLDVPLFAGDQHIEGKWYLSAFGYYAADGETQWIYQEKLGWIYSMPDRASTTMWFYLNGHGWMWTSNAIWPNVWSGETNSWLYLHLENGIDHFYSYNSQVWSQI